MIEKKIFLRLLCCLLTISCRAADGEYAVSRIPAALLKNADIIKRKEEIRFEIVDMSSAREYHTYALTVLNENGNKLAFLEEFYDKWRTIESIKGTLYDGEGRKIKTLKKSDIQDYSGTTVIDLADDNRIKYHNFYCKVYPYTIEYTVETKYNYTMFFPLWIPLDGSRYSVEESKISIICPQDYHFRYKALRFSGEPIIQTERNSKTYTWEVTNLNAIQLEYASPHLSELIPAVCFGPDQFRLGNYSGDMDTWQDFGKFINVLNQGRDELPDDVKKQIHALTDPLTDIRQKISKAYEFMQQNTRYVSIQLGIGGWQPFDAKYVAAKKYGDCKALSNYMHALLKEIGIRSCYTLINGGENINYLISDFPASYFNHAILCVPLGSDTMWLECTSQTLPAGYLGGFTENRYALAIDETGGKLIRTPKYSLNDNVQKRVIHASIDADGNLNASMQGHSSAMEQDQIEMEINYASKDKLMEYIKSNIDLPTFDISNFIYTQEKGKLPPVADEQLDLTANNYAQVSGKRLFIDPDILTRSDLKPEIKQERKYDISIDNEFRDIDSIEIQIPSGYSSESIPGDVKIESPFGKYFSTVKVEKNKIVYYRFYEQFSGNFPAADYSSMVNFYEQIYKADRSEVVLVKNQ